MLHDGWFWAFTVLLTLVMLAFGVFGYMVFDVYRTDKKTPRGDDLPLPVNPPPEQVAVPEPEVPAARNVAIDISTTSSDDVNVVFSRSVRKMDITPTDARNVAKALMIAADRIEPHKPAEPPKPAERLTAWDLLNRD